MKANTGYKDPVARLLEIGEARWLGKWLDYSQYGITAKVSRN